MGIERPAAGFVNHQKVWSLQLRALGAATAAAGTAAPHRAAPPRTCTGQFDGQIVTGPAADLSLTGRLTVSVSSAGTVKGILTAPREAGIAVRRLATVSGRVHGRSVRLVFVTAHGRRITGTGPARGIAHCGSPLTGRLSAPRTGHGVWSYLDGNALYIPAPSFSHLCLGNGFGTYLLFSDGRIYDCGRQAFAID